MIRDPDGYPVELMQLTPAPQSLAPEGNNILGAHMSVVVSDLTAASRLLSALHRIRSADAGRFRMADEHGVQPAQKHPERRVSHGGRAAPGSAITLELIQFRGVEQTPYRPIFQDIGFGHVALLARDIEAMHARMNRLGSRALSQSGSWTQFNPTTRALYTRDRDGFFIEVLERR